MNKSIITITSIILFVSCQGADKESVSSRKRFTGGGGDAQGEASGSDKEKPGKQQAQKEITEEEFRNRDRLSGRGRNPFGELNEGEKASQCVNEKGKTVETDETVAITITYPYGDEYHKSFDHYGVMFQHKDSDYRYYSLETAWDDEGYMRESLTVRVPRGAYQVRVILVDKWSKAIPYSSQFCPKVKQKEDFTFDTDEEITFKACDIAYAPQSVKVKERMLGIDRFLDLREMQSWVMAPLQEVVVSSTSIEKSSIRLGFVFNLDIGLTTGAKTSMTDYFRYGFNLNDTAIVETSYEARLMLQKHDPYGGAEMYEKASDYDSGTKRLKVSEGYPFTAQCLITGNLNPQKMYATDHTVTVGMRVDKTFGSSAAAGTFSKDINVSYNRNDLKHTMKTLSYTFASSMVAVREGDTIEGLWYVCNSQLLDLVKDKIDRGLERIGGVSLMAIRDKNRTGVASAINVALFGPNDTKADRTLFGYKWQLFMVAPTQDMGGEDYMIQGVIGTNDNKRIKFVHFLSKEATINPKRSIYEIVTNDGATSESIESFKNADYQKFEALESVTRMIAFSVFQRDQKIQPLPPLSVKALNKEEIKKSDPDSCGSAAGDESLVGYFDDNFPFADDKLKAKLMAKPPEFSVPSDIPESPIIANSMGKDEETLPLVCGANYRVSELYLKKHTETKQVVSAKLKCAYTRDSAPPQLKTLGFQALDAAVQLPTLHCNVPEQQDPSATLRRDRIMTGIKLQWDKNQKTIVDLGAICSGMEKNNNQLTISRAEATSPSFENMEGVPLLCPDQQILIGYVFSRNMSHSQTKQMTVNGKTLTLGNVTKEIFAGKNFGGDGGQTTAVVPLFDGSQKVGYLSALEYCTGSAACDLDDRMFYQVGILCGQPDVSLPEPKAPDSDDLKISDPLIVKP